MELIFLTHVIWKQVADPWREIMVEYARKYSQIWFTKAEVLAELGGNLK